MIGQIPKGSLCNDFTLDNICHPERSEGDNGSFSFFTSFRMTKV
jgi:hypothetical protein